MTPVIDDQWKTPDAPKSGAAVLKVEGDCWHYFNDLARDAKGRFPGKLAVRRLATVD